MNLVLVPTRLALAVTLGLSLAACGANSGFGSGTATTTTNDLLQFRTTALPPAYVGETFSSTVALSGGVNPYSLRVSSGTLPPGVRLVGTTLSGTPTAVGTFNFSVEATDGALSVRSQALTLSVTELPAVAIVPVLGAAGATFRSDTRIPLRLDFPRTTRVAQVTWRLPSGVTITSVAPGNPRTVLFWKQSGPLVSVVLGFTAPPTNGTNVALLSARFAAATRLDATSLGFETRDLTGRVIGQRALPAATAATPAASSTSTPASGAANATTTNSTPGTTNNAGPTNNTPAGTGATPPNPPAPTPPAPSDEDSPSDPPGSPVLPDTSATPAPPAPPETTAPPSPPTGTTPAAPTTPAPAGPPAPTAPATIPTAPSTSTTSTPSTTAPSTTAAASTTGPLADFARLIANYNQSGENLPGDLNDDDKVDAADLRLFAASYPLP